MIRRRYVFYGRVQGVGFRAFCLDAAMALCVRGWVRNLPDGSVEMEAEAAPPVLEDLLRRVRTGHPWARVEHVQAIDVASKRDDSEGFDVTF